MQAEEKTDKWREFTCIGLREEIHLAGRGGGQAWLGSPAAIISWYQRSESSLGTEGLLHAGWVWSVVQVKGGWMGKRGKIDTARKEEIHALKVWSRKLKVCLIKPQNPLHSSLYSTRTSQIDTQAMVNKTTNTSTPGNNTHLNRKWLGGATLGCVAGVDRVSDNSLEWSDWRCGGGVNFGHPEELV